MYISDWAVHTDGLATMLQKAVSDNKISPDDAVWTGPSGDAVVGDDAYEHQYADYTEAGFVHEYMGLD